MFLTLLLWLGQAGRAKKWVTFLRSVIPTLPTKKYGTTYHASIFKQPAMNHEVPNEEETHPSIFPIHHFHIHCANIQSTQCIRSRSKVTIPESQYAPSGAIPEYDRNP